MGYHDGEMSREQEFGMTRESVTAWEAMTLIKLGLHRLKLAATQAEEEIEEGKTSFRSEHTMLARDGLVATNEIEEALKKEGLDQIILPVHEVYAAETKEKVKRLEDWSIT